MAKKQKLDNYSDDFIETELYADYDPTYKNSKNKFSKDKKRMSARLRVEDHFDKKTLMKKVIDWDNYLNS